MCIWKAEGKIQNPKVFILTGVFMQTELATQPPLLLSHSSISLHTLRDETREKVHKVTAKLGSGECQDEEGDESAKFLSVKMPVLLKQRPAELFSGTKTEELQ